MKDTFPLLFKPDVYERWNKGKQRKRKSRFAVYNEEKRKTGTNLKKLWKLKDTVKPNVNRIKW